MSHLPRGWTEVALGDVAVVDRSTIRADEITRGTLYIGLEDIEAGGTEVRPHPVESGELGSNKFRFDRSHILYGKLRPYLAKIAAAPVEGICSTDILPIRPTKVDQRYLLHFLRQPAMVDYATARSSGANLPRLAPKELERFTVPLPPLEEQRRIAAILDKADELRAKRRSALDKLDSLTQSIFLDMFGDPIRGSNDRPRITLGEVAEIVGGGTPSRARPEFFQGSTCWATSKDMKASVLRDTEEHITPEAIAASATKLVPAGAVLVVVKSKVLANRLPVAVAAVETCFGQDLKAVLPNDRWQSSFLAESIRAAAPWLLRQARGVNTEGLTLEHLRSTPLWDATTKEQAEFERRRQAVDRASSAGVASAAEVDSLFASIQSRAFRGEL